LNKLIENDEQSARRLKELKKIQKEDNINAVFLQGQSKASLPEKKRKNAKSTEPTPAAKEKIRRALLATIFILATCCFANESIQSLVAPVYFEFVQNQKKTQRQRSDYITTLLRLNNAEFKCNGTDVCVNCFARFFNVSVR
jgi:hypothetical protein